MQLSTVSKAARTAAEHEVLACNTPFLCVRSAPARNATVELATATP